MLGLGLGVPMTHSSLVVSGGGGGGGMTILLGDYSSCIELDTDLLLLTILNLSHCFLS